MTWSVYGALALTAVGLLVLMLLAGCTGPATVASKDDMSSFTRDNYICIQESRTFAGGSGVVGLAAAADAQREANKLYRMCMEARGYTITAR